MLDLYDHFARIKMQQFQNMNDLCDAVAAFQMQFLLYYEEKFVEYWSIVEYWM